ncbi:AAA family ATPase [Spirochaetales bacterium NM-380-WT-3C1]|uniref:AAA family ATPase n=1 Tax=Bullifex porci TaxID=2606638 RepID=A0A7X2TPC8_9SPIO|nr:AAA family ATPase [Bullifex porci]MSU05269.1 AAA family ATPase [Bullifex porci]
MKTCKEKAIEWNISTRAVNVMCQSGKIEGVKKEKGVWMIPNNAEKPIDGRTINGKQSITKLKPLPIGISDYIRAQEEYYYVDKTLLIKDFLDKKPLVSLFTRPRRFGKTLNMDMLRVFFEISDEDTSKYFINKQIWKCGKEYQAHQGKYPVIFLTFKDVKFDSWTATLDKIKGLLQEEYARHIEVLDSNKISQYEKDYFLKILNGNANEVDISSALERLSKILAIHYKKNPIIIIDEYDTPIQEGYIKEFYDEIISFMRNFFSGAFKDNKYLSYGFLTGILRISQESIFSGMNNISVHSLFDEEYESYFGFTEDEVKNMLSYYGKLDKETELKNWYDGYLFGKKEIYNPWSVINYISRDCIPQAYWANSGSNEILHEVMQTLNDDSVQRLNALLQGEKVVARIDQNVIYRSIKENSQYIYSLLIVAGYLKPVTKYIQEDGNYLCEVKIPNKEIEAVYRSEVLSSLVTSGVIKRTTMDTIVESLFSNSYERLQLALSEYLNNSISFFDKSSESFYHGLMLGLLALMDNQYIIKSNREAGDGRYDISLLPRQIKYPAIIIELKYQKNITEDKLNALAHQALSQINLLRYDSEFKQYGFEKVLKYAIAFSGKKVNVVSEIS